MNTSIQPENGLTIPEIDVVQRALRELEAGLRKMYDHRAPRILIYGSYARSEANESSDLDVVLLYPHTIRPGEEIRRVSSILADLNLRYQILISVLPVDETKYLHTNTPFWRNIRREGYLITRVPGTGKELLE